MIAYCIDMGLKKMNKCPKCGVSRFKVKDDERCNDNESINKGPPTKVLWYSSIIPRFKRLFANGGDAKGQHGM